MRLCFSFPFYRSPFYRSLHDADGVACMCVYVIIDRNIDEATDAIPKFRAAGGQSVGSEADSYFEYLLKVTILLCVAHPGESERRGKTSGRNGDSGIANCHDLSLLLLPFFLFAPQFLFCGTIV